MCMSRHFLVGIPPCWVYASLLLQFTCLGIGVPFVCEHINKARFDFFHEHRISMQPKWFITTICVCHMPNQKEEFPSILLLSFATEFQAWIGRLCAFVSSTVVTYLWTLIRYFSSMDLNSFQDETKYGMVAWNPKWCYRNIIYNFSLSFNLDGGIFPPHTPKEAKQLHMRTYFYELQLNL